MVKRYAPAKSKPDHMVEVTNGDYVGYEDYAAKCLDVETARDNVAALEAECTRLKDLYKKMNESRDDWRDIAKRHAD